MLFWTTDVPLWVSYSSCIRMCRALLWMPFVPMASFPYNANHQKIPIQWIVQFVLLAIVFPLESYLQIMPASLNKHEQLKSGEGFQEIPVTCILSTLPLLSGGLRSTSHTTPSSVITKWNQNTTPAIPNMSS